MGRTTTTLGLLGGLAAAGWGAARWNLGRIQANPDPYPLDVIQRDLVGTTVWIDRPDGTRIRTVVAGDADAPTVVLSHGYSVSMREWNVVQGLLLDLGMRVLAFDWRGHGRTTIGADGIMPEAIAGDHVAILEHHDVHDAVFVGHSTGGYLAIAAILEQPAFAQRLRGLVLFASLAGEAAKDNPQNAAQIPLIRSGVMERIAATDTLGFPFGASLYGDDPSPAAIRVFLDEFVANDHRLLVPLLERLATTGWYERLGEIDVPTVVVCGEEDHTTPRWHSEAMGRDIPGARNVWVPGAGHMLNWEAPDVLVDVVTELATRERTVPDR
jgi:pimeloyl-ACP methyl ester carboxylesterase